jgi:cell division inhibitor SepF
MSALRKAGVWLGLIEDESDAYDERELAPTSRERHRARQREPARGYDDDYPDDYPDKDDSPRGGARMEARPTERVSTRRPAREQPRAEEPRAEDRRGNVRSITREPTVSPLSRDSYASREHPPTRDNLALAPQVHVPPQERPVPDDDRRYQITTLHPTTYREARTIGEHFREGTPVIMNLTEMEEADARRLVDFGAGLAFGLRGTMERVTNRVFLLSPANVHVTAEDKAKIAGGEFFHHR